MRFSKFISDFGENSFSVVVRAKIQERWDGEWFINNFFSRGLLWREEKYKMRIKGDKGVQPCFLHYAPKRPGEQQQTVSCDGQRKCPGKHANTWNTRGTTSSRESTSSVLDSTACLSVRLCLCEAGFVTSLALKGSTVWKSVWNKK